MHYDVTESGEALSIRMMFVNPLNYCNFQFLKKKNYAEELVYTLHKAEVRKKGSMLIAKRKIESFCPLNGKETKNLRKSKVFYEPLFNSYVFAYTEESNISLLKKIDGVISLVHWKGKPAIVKTEEIEAIREFTSNHHNIRLERIKVNGEGVIIDGPSYTMDGKILMVKNRSFNVNLPSLGYTMIAEIEVDSIRGVEISFGNKELLLQ